MRVFGLLVFILILALIGTFCLLAPSKIQQFALKSSSGKFNPWHTWMKKPAYLVSVRLCGIIALSMAGILSWVFFFNVILVR